MGKILRNIYACLKGLTIKIFHPLSDIKTIRVFRGASLRFYKGCKVSILGGVKIDENAVIAVQKDGVLSLGGKVGIGPNNYVVCHRKISIGEGSIFGPNVYIYDHDHLFDSGTGVDSHNYKYDEVIIGKKCWIGANTVILKGTHIGDNCVIGAGCVIKGDYPSGSIIIQKRETCVNNIRSRS